VLVVQADDFNRSAIQTVVIVAITSNLGRAAAPGNVSLSRTASGLPKKSVVNVSQVLTIDRGFLRGKVRKLNDGLMAEVDAGLRLALEL
jgi:mRNA interferase MazF